MSNSLFLLNNERKPVAEVVHLSEPQEPLCPLNDAIEVHCHYQQKIQLTTSKISARVLGKNYIYNKRNKTNLWICNTLLTNLTDLNQFRSIYTNLDRFTPF